MNYTVFSDHIIGESHKKMGMECEDFSGHYSDPKGRFAIAAICDGHSDPKCFRSSVGARFGCESVIQVMTKWMEAFLAEEYADPAEEIRAREKEIFQRIRMAFVQTWNHKVNDDIRKNPITKEELSALDKPPYRNALKLYTEGKLLNNIYGATMLAVAACGDFHMAMQIGDGVIVKLEEGGVYTVPVEEDDKDEMEGPESMCDSDLLSREKAFRISWYPGCPQALFVMSDGVGDMPVTLQLRERLCAFHRELIRKADHAEPSFGITELNNEQKEFLHSFVAFHSKQGVQDDCCLSGFYNPSIPVADVHLTWEEIQQLYQELEAERKNREKRYQDTRRKLETSYANNQARIETLTLRIGDLKKQIAQLEEQLEGTRMEQSNIQKVQETNEREFEYAELQLKKNQEVIDQRYRAVSDEGSQTSGLQQADPEGENAQADETAGRDDERTENQSGRA